jgi:hypothetical protein
MSVPMLLGAVIAIAIGGLFTESAYDSMLKVANLPFLPNMRSAASEDLQAKDAMVLLTHNDQDNTEDARVSPVLPRETTIDDILWVLQHPCLDYPDYVAVVDSREHMLLLGYTTREELKRAVRKAREIMFGDAHQGSVQRTLQRIAINASKGARHDSNGHHSNGHHSNKTNKWLNVVKSPKFFESYSPSHTGHAVSPQHTFRHLAEFIEKARAAGNVQETMFGEVTVDLYDFYKLFIIPSAFQVTGTTSVSSIIYMMSLLHTQQAFVTDFGRLSGVITTKAVQKAITANRSSAATSTGAAATKALDAPYPTAPSASASVLASGNKQDVELVANSANIVSPRRQAVRIESVV